MSRDEIVKLADSDDQTPVTVATAPEVRSPHFLWRWQHSVLPTGREELCVPRKEFRTFRCCTPGGGCRSTTEDCPGKGRAHQGPVPGPERAKVAAKFLAATFDSSLEVSDCCRATDRRLDRPRCRTVPYAPHRKRFPPRGRVPCGAGPFRPERFPSPPAVPRRAG